MSRTKTYLTALLATAFDLLPASQAEAQEQERPFAYIPDEVNPALRGAVFGVNVVVNSTICGINAWVEKRNVLEDILQCSAGAALQYGGMEISASVYNIPSLPGVGYRVTETGTALIENTLAGRKPFEYLYYSIGPALLQMDTKEGRLDFYWRILPLAGLIANIARENKFSLGDTLSFQVPVFRLPYGAADFSKAGDAIGDVVSYDPKYPSVVIHEYNHVHQYVRFRPFQLAVPDLLSFFGDKVHLRLGEDVSYALTAVPAMICKAADESCFGRRWYDPAEAESYIMQTAHPVELK
ncbi:MAG: hypothetical protein AB1668_07220 [Nanoarchaeota archaeon]